MLARGAPRLCLGAPLARVQSDLLGTVVYTDFTSGRRDVCSSVQSAVFRAQCSVFRVQCSECSDQSDVSRVQSAGVQCLDLECSVMCHIYLGIFTTESCSIHDDIVQCHMFRAPAVMFSDN